MVMVFAFAGCGENEDVSPYEIRDTEDISSVYNFPEPTYHIVINHFVCGKSEAIEFGSEKYNEDSMLKTAPIYQWFYDLEILHEAISSEDIEAVEGNAAFTFVVNGKEAFTYDYRGDKSYIIIGDNYYEVCNPSNPIRQSLNDIEK